MKNLTILFALLLIFNSCSNKNAFREARQTNTIEAYKNFLDENPDSRFSQEALQHLNHLKQEKVWNDALDQNTIESLSDYLSAYPNGAHGSEAKKVLKKLEEEHDWQQTLTRNTIGDYESFISKYPQSKFNSIAEETIYNLKLEEAWNVIKSTESVDEIESFRKRFPKSRYDQDAINLAEYLKAYHHEWGEIDQSPTIERIQLFLDKYSGMLLAENAEQKLTELDDKEWNTASEEDEIEAYEKYLELLPDGLHAGQAEKRIIDLQVKKVFGGTYGSMPPMDRVSSSAYSNTNEIEIFNNTSYTLTILYSGPNSKRIDIGPKGKSDFELPNGKYQVAAWVSNATIGKFAGTENLEGGKYSVEYYISTRYY